MVESLGSFQWAVLPAMWRNLVYRERERSRLSEKETELVTAVEALIPAGFEAQAPVLSVQLVLDF